MAPCVARRVAMTLAQTGDDAPCALSELVASDPALTVRVLRKTRASTIDEAVDRLGEDALRGTLLVEAFDALFCKSPRFGAQAAAFWKHALGCALCAERIAARHTDIMPQKAYVAGLLHDLGTLAMACVRPDAWTLIRRKTQTARLAPLDAERQVFGLDHTLVGKRVAEGWGLPVHVLEAAWLHHHPSRALDACSTEPALLKSVVLANLLSRTITGRGPLHRPSPQALRAGQGLGLNSGDLDRIQAEVGPRFQRRVAAYEGDPGERASLSAAFRQGLAHVAGVSSGPVGMGRDLRNRVRGLEALHRMNLLLEPGYGLGATLDALVDAVREATGVAPGVCCAKDASDECLYMRTWRTLEDRPQALAISLEHMEAGDPEDGLTGAVRALWNLGSRAASSTSPRPSHAEHRAGMLVVPVVGERGRLGQIVLEPGRLKGFDLERLMHVLAQLSEAAALAIRRRHAEERALRKSEQLASSLRDEAVSSPGDKPRDEEVVSGNRARSSCDAIRDAADAVLARVSGLQGRIRSPENYAGLDEIAREAGRIKDVLTRLDPCPPDMPPVLRPHLVNFLLQDTVAGVRDQLHAQGIGLVEQYQKGLPRTRLDRGRMVEVLHNIMAAVVEVLRASGGTVLVRTAVETRPRCLRVCIAGNRREETPAGRPSFPGASKDLNACRKTCEQALGVCRAAMGGHPGEVALVEISPTRVAFEIVLPVTSDAAGMADPGKTGSPTAAQPSLTPHRARLLVADDDEGVRELLRQTFETRGYSVLTAGDGEEAVGLFDRERVDLAVLDASMSGTGVFTILAELRGRGDLTPVIVMTGSARPDAQEEARRLGACVCLKKPFEVRRLMTEIASLLGRPELYPLGPSAAP